VSADFDRNDTKVCLPCYLNLYSNATDPYLTFILYSCYLYIAVHLYEGFGKQLQDLRPLCSNHKTTLLAQYSSEESPHFWYEDANGSNNTSLFSSHASRHLSNNSSGAFRFGETLSFPVRYKELPRNATLLFAVYGITGPQEKILHAIHTVTLFDEHGFACMQGRTHYSQS
jgi:hypothetical protein